MKLGTAGIAIGRCETQVAAVDGVSTTILVRLVGEALQ
jgi:hypothetical protein